MGKEDFMKTDMTQGKPVKVLLGFTIPVFIGNVFQQFYNMVDAVVVGKFVQRHWRQLAQQELSSF